MLKYCLAIVGVILGWVMVVPAFELPDEQAHFGTVSYLLSTGSMPSYDHPDLTLEMTETQKLLGIYRDGLGNNLYTYHPLHHVEYRDSLIGIHEEQINTLNAPQYRDSYVGSEAAKYPPLYYRLASLYTWVVNSSGIITRLFVTRLSGIDLAFGMAIVTYLIGLQIFGKKSYAALLTFMVMLQPMMSFVTSGINSDNLHNLLFFIVTYFSILLIKSGVKLKYLVGLTLIIAFDIYTKPQGFIAIPIAGIGLLIAVIRHRQWKLLGYSLVLGLIVLILGYGQWEKYRHLLSVANSQGGQFVEYLRFSLNKLLAQNVVWYWGVFKWLGVVLPPIYWRIANRVVLLSVIGIAIYLWKVLRRKQTIIDPYILTFMILSSLTYALVIFWYDWQHTKINGYSLGIQARYFFPTIVAHMSIMLTGIVSFGWNNRSRLWLRRFLFALFLWLQLGGIWRMIEIYYPGSSLPEIITQASQYKPIFAKGGWWYLWITVYLSSLIFLVKNSRLWGNPGAPVPDKN